MAKGRQKGQTKIMSKIKDKVITPYELWLEEDQIVLMDMNKNKPMGYYSIILLVCYVKRSIRFRSRKSV